MPRSARRQNKAAPHSHSIIFPSYKLLKTRGNFLCVTAIFPQQHRQKVRLLKSRGKLVENFFVRFHGLSLSIGRFFEIDLSRVIAA